MSSPIRSLRHRSACSAPYDLWEYDPARKILIGTVRFGSSHVDFEITVCSERAPRDGAFGICRRSAEAWELTAGEYREERGQWIARPSGLVSRLAPMTYILLCAPVPVDTELEAL